VCVCVVRECYGTMPCRDGGGRGGGWLTGVISSAPRRSADIGLMCNLWKLTTTHLQRCGGHGGGGYADLLTRRAGQPGRTFLSHHAAVVERRGGTPRQHQHFILLSRRFHNGLVAATLQVLRKTLNFTTVNQCHSPMHAYF